MAFAEPQRTRFLSLSPKLSVGALELARAGFEELRKKAHTLIVSEEDVEDLRDARMVVADYVKKAGFKDELQTYAIAGIKGFILFGEGLMVISEGE